MHHGVLSGQLIRKNQNSNDMAISVREKMTECWNERSFSQQTEVISDLYTDFVASDTINYKTVENMYPAILEHCLEQINSMVL